MATSTVHPNHQLISSEDVEGTNVYDMKGTQIGEIDHLMIDKVSGRVTYAVMSFGSFLGLGHSHYPIPGRAQVRHQSRRLSHERHRAAAQRRPSVQ
jgi:sporulation protein YlmC with PRC-barrel domain